MLLLTFTSTFVELVSLRRKDSWQGDVRRHPCRRRVCKLFLSQSVSDSTACDNGTHSRQWLGRQSFLDDLESLDPDLYNGLVFLKHYEGNVEDLSLNFTAAIDGRDCSGVVVFVNFL